MAKVYLDCDGVILDWAVGFGAYITERTGIVPDGPAPESFTMETWLGLPKEEIIPHILAFNETPGSGFEDLPLMQGALEGLQRLRADGHDLRVLTASSSNPESQRIRQESLVAKCGDIFDEIRCIGLHESKKDILAAYPDGHWVEDLVPNADLGAAAGHVPHVIRHRHNIGQEAERPDFHWHDGLDEVAVMLAEPAVPAP